MRNFNLYLLCIFLFAACKNSTSEPVTGDNEINTEPYQAISLLGDTLRAAGPSEALIAKLNEHKERYAGNPDSLDLLIWSGRFTAYGGSYKEAISLYTDGLKDFPGESRLLRHRGHRYISIREFDKAIADLSEAAELIKGEENSMEEDGMPNARNIPVSSKHGNIYYHLGLAHYLNHDFPKALEAYQMCLATSNNPDNVVSATHWIYMILRRMNKQEDAAIYLEAISEEMNVIENMAYHKACLLYKGKLQVGDILHDDEMAASASSALKYGIANWYYYNGEVDKAKDGFEEIVSGDDWASFGYIAAEADLAKIMNAK